MVPRGRHLLLGPARSLQVLPKADPKSDLSYLAYASKDKVAGLVKLPLDGNPHKAMGLIAHPGEISAIACTHDGRYLLTAGRHDATVQCWELNTGALEAQALLGREGMEPFLDMLGPGGREGAAYREMEDHFFYAQLRVQGEDSTEERRIGHRLTVDQVAPIMQAVGFYPSQRETFDMLNEIRFTNLANSVEEVETVTFDELIRRELVYLNHRPVVPPTEEDIAASLRFARDRENPELYSRKALSELLEQYGEAMSASELDSLLEGLVKGTKLEGNISATFDLRTFVTGMLGFEPPADDSAEGGRGGGVETARFAEGTVV
ncbi:MAG: hypothetical protein BJ554DRAFT_4585 [Olpidium bornovanus]|uniref:Cilia- and flagella-associated protein 251 n=1 Tax=Olpidium bornovanus TaxID=278681 RepID=A0A8H7ZM16_9FUNG|nr:MAG: hypothetical protein BJ554DRAFT_4585 [Olpidium bornovanus]